MTTRSYRALALPALGYLIAYLVLGVLTLEPEWVGLDLDLRQVVWLSSGVGIAAVLRLGVRVWPAIFVAEVLVTLLTGGGPFHAMGTGAANALEAVVAGLLLRRVGVDENLRSGADIAALVVLAAGVAGLLGAGVATLSLVSFAGVPWSRFGSIMTLWWLTHANGMVLLAPLILAFREPRFWTVPRVIEACFVMLSVTVLGLLVFWAYDPTAPGRHLLYAPFPLLIWAGIRFGVPGAATGNLVLSAVAMGATALHIGPFAAPALSTNERLFQLWVFVAVNAITALVVAGVVEDRKRSAQDLVRTQERLRSVLEATADGIIAADTQGDVSFVNQRFVGLWDPESGTEPPVSLRYDDPRVASLLEVDGEPLSELLESEEELLDEVDLHDGRTFERFGAPLRRAGAVSGRIWAFRDLTERRRLEEQVQQTRQLESLGLLAGGIAHDFNNLLVAIMGNADLAETALQPSHPARDHVDEVLRASQRAADLCQQMLAYAGKGRATAGPVDLNEVVAEMVELMGVALAPEITLTLELAPSLPPVDGDVVQIRQVVLNLLTNAADALGATPGRIEVSTFEAGEPPTDLPGETDAVVDARRGPGPWVGLRLSDTGSGMDEATRQRIFDPFFSTKARGRGLGLAAVLGIVRGHQGALGLETMPGRGTTVRLLFPQLPHSARPSPVANQAEADLPTSLRGRVLVVDDEETVREVAVTMLEVLGLETVEARDGVEAMDRYREDPEGIDLVLLDLTMPRMGGADAALALRALDPGLPIILSTGYLDAPEVLAGRSDLPLLKKPYRRDQLYRYVRELLAP